jgi:transcriptional regulator with XRE-family HTH domain
MQYVYQSKDNSKWKSRVCQALDEQFMTVSEIQNRTTLRADRLRSWREKRGWSQRELARHCGLGEAQVNKYESGQTDPSAKYLKALAETLGLSTDYLLGLTDNPRGELGDSLKPEQRKLLDALDEGDSPTALAIVSDILRQQKK